jgi:hypothetical protein
VNIRFNYQPQGFFGFFFGLGAHGFAGVLALSDSPDSDVFVSAVVSVVVSSADVGACSVWAHTTGAAEIALAAKSSAESDCPRLPFVCFFDMTESSCV